MVDYPALTREQAYKILNRTTINALGVYGFKEEFLKKIDSLISTYGNPSTNGKKILKKLEDLVFFVYSQPEKIQAFSNDVNNLRDLLCDFKINKGTNYKQEENSGVKKRRRVRKGNFYKNCLDTYLREVREISCPITSTRGLSEEEKKKLIDPIKEKISTRFNNVEAEKFNFFRLVSENEIFYSIFEKYFKVYQRTRNKKLLRNSNGLKKDAKLEIISSIKTLFSSSYEFIHGNDNIEKITLDSVCSKITQNLINTLNPILLEKIADAFLIRYNNLWKLKCIEDGYLTKNQKVPQKLTEMIEYRRRKINPRKTSEVLLEEGRTLNQHRDTIRKERNKIVLSLLGFGIYKANIFADKFYGKSNKFDGQLEDLIQINNLKIFHSLITADPRRSLEFLSYIHCSTNRSMSFLATKLSLPIYIPSHIMGQIIKYNKIRNKKPGITDKEIAGIMGIPIEEIELIKSLREKPIRLQSKAKDTSTSSIEGIIPNKEKNALEKIIESETSGKIMAAVSELKGRDAKIIRLHYGLDSGNPMNLQEIGERFGLTRERVRQLKEKAINNLKKKLKGNGIAV